MKFDKEKIITTEIELVEVFNNHYINTIEESSRKKAKHSHVLIILKTKGLLYK